MALMENCVRVTTMANTLNIVKYRQNSSSLFLKYKKTFSVVILALVDANYKFTIIDVGGYDNSSDRGLFARKIFGKSLEASTLNIPNSKPPPNIEEPISFVAVGD
jgi:hypothetical protein